MSARLYANKVMDGASSLGGDMNIPPDTMAQTGFDREIAASIMFPDTLRGTFRTSVTSSLIDYFLVSDLLAPAVASLSTVEGSGIKGHVPVQLKFKPKVTALKALHIRRPPPLALERVYGPIPPPPQWQQAQQAAEAALAAARAGSSLAEDLLERAYKEWIDTAETELEDYAGCQVKKKGIRGLRPNMVWRSVMPEKPPPQSYPKEAVTSWLRATVMELQRIGTHAMRSIQAADAHNEHPPTGDDGGQTRLTRDLADMTDAYDDDDDDEDRDDEDHEELPITNRTRGSPTLVDHCRCLVAEILKSLTDDMPDAEAPVDIHETHNKVKDAAERALAAVSYRLRHDGDATLRRADVTSRPMPTLWKDVDLARIEACAAEANELRTFLDGALKQVEDRRVATDQQQWKEWIHEGIDTGAARAHAFTRAPQAWVPTVAT